MKMDEKLIAKLADIPLPQPGFNALDMTAPVLMQMNPNGKWESQKPSSLDEERLRAVVQHLVSSKALTSAQSFCGQCASESQKSTGGAAAGKSNYVPVIMMPIHPADQCPFDMECEIQKMKESETKPQKKNKATAKSSEGEKDKAQKKPKKRGFVMQRLTDFDLLSQW